jgi:hypothetical protein
MVLSFIDGMVYTIYEVIIMEKVRLGSARGKTRLISKEELHELATKKYTSERLKYIRELLDDMYPKEYSKKRVAEACPGITYQGLHFLEEKSKEPRQVTIQILADYYKVPLKIFSNEYYTDTPERFYIGKEADQVINFNVPVKKNIGYEFVVTLKLFDESGRLFREEEMNPEFKLTSELAGDLIERINHELEFIARRLPPYDDMY